MRTLFVVICLPFMEENRRSNFSGRWTISSPNGGEVSSYFRKGDLFPLCITAFQIGTLLRVSPYFVGSDEVSS